MLELSTAQQAEAAVTYHKTVLQAWHEVVNAIAAHQLEQSRRARLRAQLDHTRAALDLSRSSYNDGVTDFLSVLDAERSLLQNEQQYASSTENVSLAYVTLFKALGRLGADISRSRRTVTGPGSSMTGYWSGQVSSRKNTSAGTLSQARNGKFPTMRP